MISDKFRSIIISFVSILLFLVPSSGICQENKTEVLNLDKISDDLKYRNAVRFIELERSDKALEELNEYLEIYYNGIHRNEAYFNLADIYFKSFDFQKAANIYRALYEEFSNTEDGIEAYYRIGLCQKKMGNDNKAVNIFREIISEYPASGFAYYSQIQIDLLKVLNDDL